MRSGGLVRAHYCALRKILRRIAHYGLKNKLLYDTIYLFVCEHNYNHLQKAAKDKTYNAMEKDSRREVTAYGLRLDYKRRDFFPCAFLFTFDCDYINY